MKVKNRINEVRIALACMPVYLFLGIGNLMGQNRPAKTDVIDLVATGLQIGDQVPDIPFENIHNSSRKTTNLYEFKGNSELLILDFWATWCTPCIAVLPKMDSLKNHYGERVSFLSVTYEDDKKVLPFWAGMEERLGRPLNIPFMTSDTLLRKFFPHRSIPHYVWLNKEGDVIAITEQDEINEANIDEMLAGRAVLAQKQEFHRAYNKDIPLFLEGNGGTGKELIYRSVLSGYVRGLVSRMNYDPSYKDNSTRLTLINSTLQSVYATAYGARRLWILQNRIQLNVANSDRLTSPLTGQAFERWMSNGNAFCYESILPGRDNQEVYDVMKSDLRRLFPQYNAELKILPIRCLALIKTASYKDLTSAEGEPKVEITGQKCFIQNASIDFLTARLAYYHQRSPYPVINATGISVPVDLAFEANLSNVDELNEVLAPYGLRLEEGIHETEILVIEDSDTGGDID